jgi:23S rRNA pseudouridine1911/1915/1917 synthase
LTADRDDRADRTIARAYPEAGRRQVAELFDDGSVRIAGKRARKGDRVTTGTTIELAREPTGKADLRPVADPAAAERIAILLERPDVVAIAKPAGMPTQPLRAGELGTVANALAARFPECAGLGDDSTGDRRDGGVAHRLDIGTSGVVIAGRTADAYRMLRGLFGAGSADKTYLAITCGRPVSRECDASLAQRGKRVVVDEADGLTAHTDFEVASASPTHALVRCTARSGRMHQVRAHLAHVGAPILGDVLYGGEPLGDDPGFFLHAARVELPLAPPLVVEAPVPERFAAALAALGLIID